MRELLPAGFGGLLDLPYTLFGALRLGLMFLSWEELPSEEQPPRSIWLDNRKLKEHFDRVKREREEKYGSGSGAIEDPVQNAAASSLISG